MLFPEKLDETNRKLYEALLNKAGKTVTQIVAYLIRASGDIEKASATDQKECHSTAFLLLHDLIESLDGFGILVFNGSAINCAQLVRTAFECQLGLFYIWESASTYDQRALSYQLGHIHSKLKWAQRADAESNVGKELRRNLKDAPHVDVFDVKAVDIKGQIAHWEALLKTPKWAPFEAEWQRTKKGAGEPAWHQLYDGPKNVRELAYHLGKGAAYESLYRWWSEVAHGQNAFHRVKDQSECGIELRPIRSPEGLLSVCRIGCTIGVETVRTAIQKCVPTQWDSYRAIYLEELREPIQQLEELSAFDKILTT